MIYRLAKTGDEKRLYELLYSVQELHANGRPDVFKKGASKYSEKQISEIIKNERTPVFVATNEKEEIKGYAFCSVAETEETSNLKYSKDFYIDDFCIEKSERGKGEGEKLYLFVLKKAKEYGCRRVTLNVWHLNESAVKFYQKIGMTPLKTTMEHILD